MGFFKKQKGIDCQENEDGSRTCKRYKIEDNEPLATGSEITIAQDPNTCSTRFIGNMRLNDEDKRDLIKIAKDMEASCKKGF